MLSFKLADPSATNSPALASHWRDPAPCPIPGGGTVSELAVRIVIPVNKQAILYKIHAFKAKQLHMLGMDYEAIGRSLKIGQETARKACHF